jgi:hypothetical protein
MSARRHVASVVALAGSLLAVSAYAQEFSGPAPAPAPANLAFVVGVVDVVQDGVASLAEAPVMLIEGDSVRTRSGRGEIVFGDGSVLHLSVDSTLDILGEERVRLSEGRLLLRVSHAAGRPYVIDTPSAPVRFDAEGEYGIIADRSGRLEVTVARGSASLEQWSIRGGQMISIAAAGARPLIEPFNSARWDAFATWSDERATAYTTSASAEQLPYELRAYSPVFDRYGRWDHLEPYGRVWFPSVGIAWRPYYDGSWAFTRYGWTWQGRDYWAWPTHHYGRWGFTGAFWYWVPATVWAPAWVTWGLAPGYVSWAPLGWYVPGYVDPWGRRDHPAYAPYSYYSPWRGWTVLPRNQFGPRRNVRAYAVDGNRLDEVTQRAVMTPPGAADDFAIPRNSFTRPGSGGNVRRPPSGRPTPAGAAPGGETPSSTTPTSWSDAAAAGARRGAARATAPENSQGGRGSSTDRAGADRDGTDRGAAGRAGAERGSGDRRGAVRDPGVRAAPRNAPSGESSAGGSSTKSDAAGAARSRPAGARPKG